MTLRACGAEMLTEFIAKPCSIAEPLRWALMSAWGHEAQYPQPANHVGSIRERRPERSPLLRRDGPAASFNQFVRRDKDRLWHRKAQRLCCLDVDDQLELSGPQNRKVVRLGTAKKLAGIYSDLTIGV